MAGAENVTAYIIAGGLSKRFGRDKSLYPYRGKPLIEHVLETLRSVFSDIGIIAADGDRFASLGVPVYPDSIPGLGPIGGIHTALLRSAAPKTFVVACDMPFLSAGFIRHMTGLCGGHDAVVPWVNGCFETLHAIYSRACLAPVERAIALGDRRIISFFGEVDVRRIDEEEIGRHADARLIFRNINYLEDIEK